MLTVRLITGIEFICQTFYEKYEKYILVYEFILDVELLVLKQIFGSTPKSN